MKGAFKDLGKVCLTPEGIWDRNKPYDRICLVTNSINNKSYISKQEVPIGIDINNDEYWQPVGSSGYRNNNVIILSDVDSSTGELIEYNLSEAIATIVEEDRKPGLILGFYGKDKSNNNDNIWYLYQYNSYSSDNWFDLSCWKSIYENIEKFKGLFENEELLIEACEFPSIGDFAFIGSNLEEAVLYICTEDNTWTETTAPALDFANKFKAVYSKDFGELKQVLDEVYADRATKDALGNIIHDTYITKEALSNSVTEALQKSMDNFVFPDECIGMNNLNESVKNYIGSKGNVVNNPDDEDITVKNDVLKFADKEHNENVFSGYGRVYLRKNVADGVNLLEQRLINKPNTIYHIQYDFCLNNGTIELPENCILVFDGGSINKGTIILNEAYVKDMFGMLNEFNRIEFVGDFKEGQLKFDKTTCSYLIYKNNEWQSLNQ